MKKNESLREAFKVKEKKVKKEKSNYICNNGITKRLLEKYKPSKGLKVLHGGRIEKKGRAA
tara:strand:+ start:134 stop:316 length:183 start_codon:yes stop_codon:yes gene_type:complete